VTSSGPVRVLIVDDSPFVRSILTRALSAQEGIEVAGGARDPFEARELIIQHRPNVIILDIEMPRMDGITFLKKIMAHYPVPVIMCSGAVGANSRVALEAIELGATDVVAKPSGGGSLGLRRVGEELAYKVKAAAMAGVSPPKIPAGASSKPSSFRDAGIDPARYLVAIGASTGGTEAIRGVLTHVPADFPAIVMVQHMPVGFTNSFAERLNELSAVEVMEAAGGDVLVPGRAFLARGDTHLVVRASGRQRRLVYTDDVPINRHCPSVEAMFNSVAEHVGKMAIGVILTGMGADGAKGLLRMRQAGAATFGQDAKSSVVYGMPKVAYDIGAVEVQVTPEEVPGRILQAIRKRERATTASATR